MVRNRATGQVILTPQEAEKVSQIEQENAELKARLAELEKERTQTERR
jgi:hypothetical protein